MNKRYVTIKKKAQVSDFNPKTRHYLTFNTAFLDLVYVINEWLLTNKESSSGLIAQQVKMEMNNLSKQIVKLKSALGDKKDIIGSGTPFTNHMVELIEFMLESEKNSVRALAVISALKDPEFIKEIDNTITQGSSK